MNGTARSGTSWGANGRLSVGILWMLRRRLDQMSKITLRESTSFFLRAFPGWNRLRTEVAGALGVPIEQVRGLNEDADPAVRMEALAFVMGFQVAVELYIDPVRAPVPPIESFALELARRLGEDVAHHDGSLSPYGYVLVRPNGNRFAVDEIVDESDGLHLDESDGCLRQLPSLKSLSHESDRE